MPSLKERGSRKRIEWLYAFTWTKPSAGQSSEGLKTRVCGRAETDTGSRVKKRTDRQRLPVVQSNTAFTELNSEVLVL